MLPTHVAMEVASQLAVVQMLPAVAAAAIVVIVVVVIVAVISFLLSMKIDLGVEVS